jgi:alkanesulfonate monooxygenase SsuD/methylene tetrahydromethanopterin reductase-like flavin-dependent oxidoreductase (luciferase family)
MGGRRLTPGQAVAALGEAIRLMRAFWSGKSPLTFEGKYYRVKGVDAGPVPAHPIRIWTGNYRPRGLRQTGELADGWLPSSAYLLPEHVPERQKLIDEGAARAGRPPTAIRRGYNVMGVIDLGRPDTPGNLRRPGLIVGPPEHWVETLISFYVDLRLDTFICWPVAGDEVVQVRAFAEQVVPAVKKALGA